MLFFAVNDLEGGVGYADAAVTSLVVIPSPVPPPKTSRVLLPSSSILVPPTEDSRSLGACFSHDIRRVQVLVSREEGHVHARRGGTGMMSTRDPNNGSDCRRHARYVLDKLDMSQCCRVDIGSKVIDSLLLDNVAVESLCPLNRRSAHLTRGMLMRRRNARFLLWSPIRS